MLQLTNKGKYMFNYIIQVTKKKQIAKFYAPDYATALGMARIYVDNDYTVVVYKNLEV